MMAACSWISLSNIRNYNGFVLGCDIKGIITYNYLNISTFVFLLTWWKYTYMSKIWSKWGKYLLINTIAKKKTFMKKNLVIFFFSLKEKLVSVGFFWALAVFIGLVTTAQVFASLCPNQGTAPDSSQKIIFFLHGNSKIITQIKFHPLYNSPLFFKLLSNDFTIKKSFRVSIYQILLRTMRCFWLSHEFGCFVW